MKKINKALAIISITLITTLAFLANAAHTNEQKETASFGKKEKDDPIIVIQCAPYPACLIP